MENDDLPVGRILSRREVVRIMAMGSGAVILGCKRESAEAASAAGSTTAPASGVSASQVPACVVKPELTVGPYFVDRQLDRSDIRAEPSSGSAVPGAALALTFNVSQVSGGSCTPLPGAMVDVWHCDANGVYSGVNDRMVGFDTTGKKFLRGYQVTDANGVARFTSIYPGWYQGRTPHIHFKIRNPATAALAANEATTWEFTSQLFFDDALSDRVYAKAPYAAKGTRGMRNADDGIYRQAGDTLLLAVADDGGGHRASFDIGLDLSDAATGRADRSGGPGGRRPPR